MKNDASKVLNDYLNLIKTILVTCNEKNKFLNKLIKICVSVCV